MFTIFLFSRTIFGQGIKYPFRTITNQDGLSQNTCHTVIQDANGFIWFGTEMGLDKYDGYSIISYTHNPRDSNSLTNIFINVLLEDADGNIYIGTDGGGLNFLDTKTDRFKHYLHNPDDSNSICHNLILSLCEDRNGNIWVGTSQGLSCLNPATGRAKHYFSRFIDPESLDHNAVMSLLCDGVGYIWAGTLFGLNRIDPETGKVKRIRYAPMNVRSLSVDDRGNIWVGSRGMGLYCLDTATCMFIQPPFPVETFAGLCDNSVEDFVIDDEGNIWVATTDSGIVCFDSYSMKLMSVKHNERIRNSLPSDKLRTIYVDRSGVLWTGTFGSGVGCFDTRRKPFKHYVSDRSGKTLFKGIGPVLLDSTGTVWMGTTAGAIRYNPAKDLCVFMQHCPGIKDCLSNDWVTCFLEDSDYNIWIGTNQGLNLYDPSTEKLTVFLEERDDTNSLSCNSIWGLCEDNEGLVWIATWGGGVNSYDRRTGAFTRYRHNPNDPGSLSSNEFNVAYKDNNGRLWFGSWEGGLVCYDSKSKTFKSYMNDPSDIYSLGHNTVMSLCEDRDAILWIGTFGGGLDRFDPVSGKFSHYTTNDGLPHNSVLGILPDNHGNLWISTGKGLAVFSPVKSSFRCYDMTDGIQGTEFSQHGSFRAKDGRLLFGGTDGFNFFHPDSIRDNNFRPSVIITAFKVRNQTVLPADSTFLTLPVYLTGEIILSYRENVFAFEYTATHYSHPEKISYAYMMEGFDPDWNYVGNERQAKYTSLSPGTYIFRVKATNCDGVWNETPATIRITIIPPFWKTTWFYILSAASALLLIWLIVRLREMKLKRDKQILEQKVKERTLEIEQQKEEIAAQRDSILEQNEKILQQKEEIETQRDEIEARSDELLIQRDLASQQRDVIALQQKEMIDSIRYAKRIQGAILPTAELAEKLVPEHFVLYKPKDIVSGDFYWMTTIEGHTVVAVADCTGHGVPGAFMSMLGAAFLNDIVNKEYITHTGVILRKLRKEVVRALQQTGDTSTGSISAGMKDMPSQASAVNTSIQLSVKDGMDIAICSINTKTMEIQFSGANNPLYVVRRKEAPPVENAEGIELDDTILYEVKGDKMPIAIYEKMDRFNCREFKLEEDDRLYMFSDGYADQFGGKRGKKFKYKPFKRIIHQNCNLHMHEQGGIIEKTLNEWMNHINPDTGEAYEQVDDITVLGIRI
ncbi:MAG: SpoIIE family protein phosphatase [Bacteroidetes bacterium]|nr:SpoIIE family protein phosphatase [Bacteroidota bacterium]